MTDLLIDAAEEWLGIVANPDDVQKLETYILDNYGYADQNIINRVFSTGEAVGFLTVNETYFFREPAHFVLLRDFLHLYENSEIRILSAATATGCEAYSIAMLIEAYNRGIKKPVSYHIDAFDINPQVIEAACKGIYRQGVLREDGSCFRYMIDPYLNKNDNMYMIDPSLKNNIYFFVHNLMNELPMNGYDFIFFRNAFIYISARYRERVLSNLTAGLKEGGTLIMGVSETAAASHADLEGKNTDDVFYFQKLKSSIYSSQNVI